MAKNEIFFVKAGSYQTKMEGNYASLYDRCYQHYSQKEKLMRLRSYALELLREALYAATTASNATNIGDKKKVWKATYEAVIASAPVNIRDMANFLRNYKGSCTTHFEV